MLYQNKILPKLKKKFLKLIGNYREIEYQQALKFFKECDSILDVGCGTGGFLELLNKNKKKEVVGIDLNPSRFNKNMLRERAGCAFWRCSKYSL